MELIETLNRETSKLENIQRLRCKLQKFDKIQHFP